MLNDLLNQSFKPKILNKIKFEMFFVTITCQFVQATFDIWLDEI